MHQATVQMGLQLQSECAWPEAHLQLEQQFIAIIIHNK